MAAVDFGPVTVSIPGVLPIERIGPDTWPVQLGDLFGLKHYDCNPGNDTSGPRLMDLNTGRRPNYDRLITASSNS